MVSPLVSEGWNRLTSGLGVSFGWHFRLIVKRERKERITGDKKEGKGIIQSRRTVGQLGKEEFDVGGGFYLLFFGI